MANKYIQVRWIPGTTSLTANVYPRTGGSAINASPISGSESGSTPGLFRFLLTESAEGYGYIINVSDAGGVILSQKVDLVEANGYYDACEGPTKGETAVQLESITTPIYLTVPTELVNATRITNAIVFIRGDTVSLALSTSLGSVASRTQVWFTVKRSADDLDSEAFLQITENEGLIIVDGVSQTDHTPGSLSVDGSGYLTIHLSANVTKLLDTIKGVWDVQVSLPSSVSTPLSGPFYLRSDVTRATA